MVRSFDVLSEVICRLIWLQGNAFVLAIEPILCCRLILNTRSTLQRPTVTELTTTGFTALEIELKAYRRTQSPARKHHLDSMGLPQLTGMSIANSVFNSLPWHATKSDASN